LAGQGEQRRAAQTEVCLRLSRAEQSRAASDETGQGKYHKAEQGRDLRKGQGSLGWGEYHRETGQGRAGQGRAGQGRAGQGRAGQSKDHRAGQGMSRLPDAWLLPA